MILVIDIGNSRIKCAVFEQNSMVEQFNFSKEDLKNNIENCLEKHPKIEHLVVASVANFDKDDFLNFRNRIDLHIINSDDDFPFTNLYRTPKTLGIDRMVLAAGAVIQFPNTNRLVIDAGTCITYDYIDQNNNYLGGAIAPGLRLRYEALHQFTAKLPLLETQNPKDFIGSSTNDAIHSGIVNGVVFEINGFTDRFISQNPNFIIILTGGDTEFLAKRLKNTIFANSNFLLESLNHKFHYKKKK
jgi:type III pantothenate kinase